MTTDDSAPSSPLLITGYDRWHDPDGSGTWTTVPCGGDVTAHSTIEGLTVPGAGTFRLVPRNHRWPEGEFFRYQITDFTLLR